MPMVMENIAIVEHQYTLHYAMLFKEMVINLKFVNSNKEIMNAYNKQQLCWI
jgi:hypothetical protein